MVAYATADLHFSHANIMKYCNRDFKNTDRMDKHIIQTWNSVVQNDHDLVYVLGDFTMRGRDNKAWFAKTLRKLRGNKILILGNHDKLHPFQYIDAGFQSVHTSLICDGIFMAHDPAWALAMPEEYCDMMICGHVHDLFKLAPGPRKVLNVGVDVWDYRPVEWSIIKEYSKEEAVEGEAETNLVSPEG